MKKIIIGSIVGGIIIFLWQFLSWGAVNLHEPVQKHTEKQDAIMNFLNSQGLEEGGYLMPTLPRTASQEEWEAGAKSWEGKPWASIQYHKAYNSSMAMRIVRQLLIDILTVFLFCWIVRRFNLISFRNIFLASLFTGLIIYFNTAYTNNIWYDTFDIWIHLLDAIVCWGLVGLWLGWWLTRGRDRIVADSTIRA